MKNLIIALLVLMACSVFQSCRKIKGEGPVITENRAITDFSSITADLSGDIYFVQDNNYKIELQGQQNILDALETNVENGTLKIYFKGSTLIGKHDRLSIYVSAPNVNSLELNGSGNLYTQEQIHTDNVQLGISGSGSIHIADITAQNVTANISGSGDITIAAGSADHESLNINGSGSINMLNVAAHSADVHISGSGTGSVNVSDLLNVRISGSGDVYYIGSPEINKKVFGSGKVKQL